MQKQQIKIVYWLDCLYSFHFIRIEEESYVKNEKVIFLRNKLSVISKFISWKLKILLNILFFGQSKL